MIFKDIKSLYKSSNINIHISNLCIFTQLSYSLYSFYSSSSGSPPGTNY